MTNKIFLLALIIILVIGCKNKISDPLNGFIIGSNESTWKGNVDRLLKDNIIFNNQINGVFDSYLLLKKDTLPVKVYINYDQYSFGKLLEYRISLNGDTGNAFGTLYFKKGAGYQRFEIVKNVYKSFIDEFGTPDQTRPVHRYPTEEDVLRTIRGDTSKIPDKDIQLKSNGANTIAQNANFISKWYFKDFNIEFYCDPISYLHDSIPRIEDSYISYFHKNYAAELKNLKDSIISTFSSKDYVECSMLEPEIKRIDSYYDSYDREIGIYFNNIRRGANEDIRSVESFKYDLILLDDYNKELFRFTDKNFVFEEPLLINQSFIYTFAGNRNGWTTKYNSKRTIDANEIEKAFINGFKISCKVEVKAVKLEDGTVIE